MNWKIYQTPLWLILCIYLSFWFQKRLWTLLIAIIRIKQISYIYFITSCTSIVLHMASGSKLLLEYLHLVPTLSPVITCFCYTNQETMLFWLESITLTHRGTEGFRRYSTHRYQYVIFGHVGNAYQVVPAT